MNITGVTMIEDINPNDFDRTSGYPPRAIRARTKPQHYTQSGMLGKYPSSFEHFSPENNFASENPQGRSLMNDGISNFQERQMSHITASTEPTCVDVAEHAANCPVCSQLYSSNNNMFYIIIAVLVLIIILLFVRVLECGKL